MFVKDCSLCTQSYEPHDKLKNEASRELIPYGSVPEESLPNAKVGQLVSDNGMRRVSGEPTCSVFVSTAADSSLQYASVKISEIDAV